MLTQFKRMLEKKPAPASNVFLHPNAPGTPMTNPARNSSLSITPIDYEHSDELPDFEEKLYELIDMSPSVRFKLCPVKVNGTGLKFSIICQRSEANSDLAREVERMLVLKGFSAANPLYIATNQSVMAELARDAVNKVSKAKKTAKSGMMTRDQETALSHMFESIAAFAIANTASDIHFELNDFQPNSRVLYRIEGQLTSPRKFYLPTADLMDTVAYLFNVRGKSPSENTYNSNKPQQCQIPFELDKKKFLFRWASNQTAKGSKVVLRMLAQDEATSIRSLEELGYLPGQIDIISRVIRRLGGGVVLAGVVGSGKSTTMQTIMCMLPETFSKYTVEDPVEYLMPGVDQFSVSRNLSDQTSDPFIAVKRQLKRMDPDAVLIGEIRDRESGGLFRDIAESGHRAFSTVHAPSALDMVTMRLVSDEIGIPRDIIATPGFLNLLMYQALVPKLCPCCKLPASDVHPKEYLQLIESLFQLDISKIYAKNAAGCDNCKREGLPELNGIKGRMVVAEMVELDAVMLHMIREGKNLELKTYVKQLQTARFDEPDTTGKTVIEVAMYHVAQGTFDPKSVEEKFGDFLQYQRERGA
ncbi:GspE/PulE family protein [Undibacterium oligocarboniphilum]|uniref:Flp pilus assembly complex ATPase component TadA n=1 Tax=Undibacterium oligocarboniphilum TaxID=666702 RepID=A0A850QIM9_9BURK|nr:ATPase, T2SS/T4P/T4SS family [Undibacterium oligocarboniphilum]MBC3871445.1 Flp pilus assembly complex ATPase component TadA [Undibacterium oligocarboniphilum]NVO78979.1 Flp pilus assembly complex ATPase component TadA [Undibacterium oligocarboniphilum]